MVTNFELKTLFFFFLRYLMYNVLILIYYSNHNIIFYNFISSITLTIIRFIVFYNKQMYTY